MKLILASQSPFRAQILKDAGFAFQVIAPNINEKLIRSDKPGVLVCMLGKEKADTVAKQILANNELYPTKDYVVLGSDQVIVCDKEVMEKPVYNDGFPNQHMARRFLQRYANHPPKTYTSVYVYNLVTGMKYANYEVATMKLVKFSEKEIEQIITDPLTFKAAGALASGIEGSLASKIIQAHEIEMQGERTGFMGLPIHMTRVLLDRVGYTFSNRKAAA